MAEQFDVLIIGTGQAGKPLALSLAKAGKKTAIVEREYVGGTCVNVGCTPTKTMVASARVAYLARRAGDYGVRTGEVMVDLAKVRQRKRDIVRDWEAGGRKKLEGTDNLTFVFGEARFVGPKEVEVNGRRLSAETVVINVGGRPSVPKISGLDGVPYLTSTTVMELGAVPGHLLVVGGGYIGLEFAQMFRRFGSKVTVVQREPRLLPREDEDVSEEVLKFVREDGIDVQLSTEPRSVGGKEGALRLTLHGPSGATTLEGTHLLVAAGRTPNADGLNLAAAGVEVNDRGYVPVDERLQTNVPGVYAAGDVNGGPQFTHVSYDDYRVLEARLLHGKDATTKGRILSYTVFTDPQVGHVGLHEHEARKSGRNVRVAKMPMSWIARALETDESRGLVKATVDADTKEILGCTVVGLEGGEIMTMVQVAMMGKLPYTALRDAIFSHPGLGEGLNTLFATLTENQ